MISLFERLESALLGRNPSVLKLLRPGLNEEDVRGRLRSNGVKGNIKSVVQLYRWKNGTRPDRKKSLEEMSIIPKSPLCFEDFELMIDDCKSFGEIELLHPSLAIENRRYFPFMWDSSSQWVAIDVRNKQGAPLVLVDTESPEPIRHLCSSLDEFLEDAIIANETNVRLRCFDF
jgi:hypothetical protein